MKHMAFVLMVFIACNEPDNSSNLTRDTVRVVKPPVNDTSRVVTPAPTGDSNVVRPDTSVKSK